MKAHAVPLALMDCLSKIILAKNVRITALFAILDKHVINVLMVFTYFNKNACKSVP